MLLNPIHLFDKRTNIVLMKVVYFLYVINLMILKCLYLKLCKKHGDCYFRNSGNLNNICDHVGSFSNTMPQSYALTFFVNYPPHLTGTVFTLHIWIS